MVDLYNPTEGQDGSEPAGTQQNTSGGDGGDFFQGSSNSELSSFLEQQANTPKQAYQHEETPDTKEDAKPVNANEKVALGSEVQVSRKALNGGKMVAKTVDYGFSVSAKYISKSPDRDKWKADEADMKELVEAWALYLETVGGEIPPWLGLLLVNLVVYAFRIPEIVMVRKQNIADEKKQKAAEAAKLARDKAAIIAEEKLEKAPAPNDKKDSAPSLSQLDEPVTECIECGKALAPHQIHRGQRFCSTAHSNQYRARQKKEHKRTIILNQN